MDDQKTQIELMIKKASEAKSSDDALKFSQAACNAANALCSLIHAKSESAK
jgi:hypothetical protein